MHLCTICTEDKEFFVTCVQSSKHQWCLDCYQAMLRADDEKCPYCRTNMRPIVQNDSIPSPRPRRFDFTHPPPLESPRRTPRIMRWVPVSRPRSHIDWMDPDE